MKEDIVKILELYLDENIRGKQNTIHKVYFDSIAQEIVKLFAIPGVSNNEVAVCDCPKGKYKLYLDAINDKYTCQHCHNPITN